MKRTYFELDPRVLGAFRAGLGAVLLYDVLRRFPDAGLLWSSEGVLSAEALHRAPQAGGQFSLLLLISSAPMVRLAFAGLGAIFLLYAAGLYTRVAQPLALLGYASLNARNLFFEDGGTGCVVLLLTWTLLLPLGDRYSLDALRRDAKARTLAERVRARARARAPVVTLATLAILLQASAIYWLNAVHKNGETWRAGDAVHLVLWQHRVNTPFALWFAAHEPSWLSPILTSLTKRAELLLPALLLWPTHPALTRSAAFVIAVLLHGGIALCLTLGPFSYAMICLVWLCVPGEALDWLAERSPRRLGLRSARARARAVSALRARWYAASPRGPKPPRSALVARRWLVLRELVIGGCLVVEGANLLASNNGVPRWLRFDEPSWLLAYKPYLRAYQSWSMFAPDAPRHDGTLVVDAVTTSGRHIDPFTGRTPDFEQVRRGLVPHSIALSDYLFAMRQQQNSRYRRELSRYLKRYRVPETHESLRSVELWWASYVPPARGHAEPGPITKEKLWRVRL